MNTTTTAMTLDQQPTGAARVGMEMRLVRERLGWRLPDVAAELRIRLPYLEAIERGELSALPGAAYQTGFVRTYSQALGLDGDEILRRFRAEGTGFVPKAELSFLAPVPDRAVPTGAIVLLCVVLVLVGYGLWYRHTAQVAQMAAQIPSIPTELAPLAVPPKPPAAVPAPKPTPPAAISSQTAAASSAQPPASQTAALPAPSPAAPAAAPPALPAATPAATPAAQRTIEATGDSWVQVQDSSGAILFSKTLHAGESWPVPNLPGLVMTAGNAGATLIADNGAKGAPLGPDGTVIRKYALTAPAQSAPAPDTAPHAQNTPAAPAIAHTAAAVPTVYTPTPANPVAAGAVEGPSPSSPVSTN
jgi:cytoskeleton protein RodZ